MKEDLILITKAAALAAKVHSGQKRKYNGADYFTHPCRVAATVALYTSDPAIIAAAYLHDVLEDTETPEKEILKLDSLSGKYILFLVKSLTNPSKEMKGLPRAERKALDRKHLSEVDDDNVKLIKLIDRIDNLKEMVGAETDFKSLYASESFLLVKVLKGTHKILEKELTEAASKLLE